MKLFLELWTYTLSPSLRNWKLNQQKLLQRNFHCKKYLIGTKTNQNIVNIRSQMNDKKNLISFKTVTSTEVLKTIHSL